MSTALISFKRLLPLCVFLFYTAAFAEIPKFMQINEKIFRGAQPQEVSDYDFLISKGVRTIINLRTTESSIAREKQRWTEALARNGVEGFFLSLPMSWITAPKKDLMEKIVAAMSSKKAGPVFIHCTKGKDRTGISVALYRVYIDKMDAQAAFLEMRTFGFNRGLFGLKKAYWRFAQPGALNLETAACQSALTDTTLFEVLSRTP